MEFMLSFPLSSGTIVRPSQAPDSSSEESVQWKDEDAARGSVEPRSRPTLKIWVTLTVT